ncbi:MAG: murein biosynthesis integral membrane protein MurJ [Bacteriovoracaceae bacterium]|nr:murein biosynthesis integral membrane protein MurJ [Bacteriovoracaceae bacterium]
MQDRTARQDRKSLALVLLSSAKMAIATFSSRILGLVRELVMASMFGASGITDAFYVAYRIPNMLRDLFAESVFSSAFVPVLTEVQKKDPQKAKGLLWSAFILLGFVTTIISILIVIFAPQFVALMAPKFVDVPEKFEITVVLTRIMAPFLVLVSIAALFMGALNTLKVFFTPSFAPAFYNLIMIGCMVALPNLMEKWGTHKIAAVAVGVIIGGFGQMLIQLPLLIKKNYGPQGPIKIFSKYTGKIINRLGIGTVGIAATQINLLVNTILASSSGVGAVSWLQYAFRMFQFPVGILGVSIAGSNLVHFSDAWKSDDKERAIYYLKTSYTLSWLVMVPAMALLYAMSDHSLHLLLERGAFDRTDTLQAGLALRMYVIGLPCYGLYKIFGPVFYSLDCPKYPVGISVVAIALNVAFCVFLTPIYGFHILALGISFSMIFNSGVQGIFLHRLLNLGVGFFFNLRVLKIWGAGVGCYFTTNYLTRSYLSMEFGFMEKVIRFCGVGAAGVAAYFVILFILGEYKIVKTFLKRS